MALVLQTSRVSCEWVGDLSEEPLDVRLDFRRINSSRGVNERHLRISHVEHPVYHVLMSSDDRFLNELALTGDPNVVFVCCAGRSFLLHTGNVKVSPISIVPTNFVMNIPSLGLCVAGFHEVKLIAQNLTTATVVIESPNDINSVSSDGLYIKLLVESREGEQIHLVDVQSLDFQIDQCMKDDLGLIETAGVS